MNFYGFTYSDENAYLPGTIPVLIISIFSLIKLTNLFSEN